MKFKFSDILYGGLLRPSYIIGQLTESGFNTGKDKDKEALFNVAYLKQIT